MGSQGVTAGLKIAADEKSSKNFKDMGKREKGIKLAVNKLTKEDIDAVKSINESYKNKFDAALEHYNIKSPSELGEEQRKEFFNLFFCFSTRNYRKIRLEGHFNELLGRLQTAVHRRLSEAIQNF